MSVTPQDWGYTEERTNHSHQNDYSWPSVSVGFISMDSTNYRSKTSGKETRKIPKGPKPKLEPAAH